MMNFRVAPILNSFSTGYVVMYLSYPNGLSDLVLSSNLLVLWIV